MNRKTSMSDSIGTTAYTYDAIGNLVAEDGPFANDTLYYDYTPDRQLAAITSSFYSVEYAYDSLGRLSTVIGAEGTNTYAYTTAGTLWTNLTLANGTTAERSFDPLLRLTNLVNRANAGILSSFALTLDDADQRTQVIREDGKVYTYAYDAIGQLTNASASLPDGTPWPGYQFSYAYDATGNPVEQNKNGLVYSNSFNNLNQNVDTVPSGTLTVLGEVNYPSGTASVNNVQAQIALDGTFVAPGIPIAIGTNTLASIFTDSFGRTTNTETTVTVSSKIYGYDLNGNLTNDSRFVYSWDCENRLTAVHDAQTGALVQENHYDALWRRREKVEYAPDGSAVTNRYIYKDWLVLAITDDSDSILETYTHGADLSGTVGGGAGGVGGILSWQIKDSSILFIHNDFIGNITDHTDNTGTTISHFSYTPYGETNFGNIYGESRNQFNSKEGDAFGRMVYFGCRFYSPSIGRWLSRDPIDETDNVTLYSFVKQSPINIFDYLGLRGNHGGNQGNHKRKPCCKGIQYDSRKECCEDGKVVDKVIIWVCKRRLGSPDGKIPDILFVSHSYVVPEDNCTSSSIGYGKQPSGDAWWSYLWSDGKITKEPYPVNPNNCRKRLVCPRDKERMSQEGETDDPYSFIIPFLNCHGWANGCSD